MKDITKKYTNGEVTIIWQPSVCIHSTICWKSATGLPEVFNPSERPWIKPDGATTDRMIEQVKKCPSGALSYYMNNEVDNDAEVISETTLEISPNGPLLVYGNITLKDKSGHTKHENKVTAFCRCGGSSNKPFCDGTHRKIDFQG